MSKPDKTFREKLLELNKPNQSYKDKYEKEIRKMLEKKFSILGRIGIVLLTFLGILFIIYFTNVILNIVPGTNPDNLIRLTYPFAVLGILLSVTWVILLLYLIISGKAGSKINLSLITGIGVAICFILIILHTFIMEYALIRANPQDWRIKLDEQLAIVVFFLLVFISLYLILRTLYRLEFKTHEKLLEIEYRLADLAEKFGGKQPQ